MEAFQMLEAFTDGDEWDSPQAETQKETIVLFNHPFSGAKC